MKWIETIKTAHNYVTIIIIGIVIFVLGNLNGCSEPLQNEDRYVSNGTTEFNFTQEDTKFYLSRGNACFEKGEYDLAIADYSKVIDIDPTYAPAYYNRGNVYHEKREYDLAVADYSRAIDLDPIDVGAYNNRGSSHYRKGEYDLAIADYSKAIDIDPTYARAYYNRGLAYYNKKEYDLAIADYSKAIDINPKDADTYYERGRTYYYKEEYDLAVVDFDRVLELNPNANGDIITKAYYQGGILYCEQRKYNRAAIVFGKALLRAPYLKNKGIAEVFRFSGDTYFRDAHYDLAIQDYSQALEMAPNNSKTYICRGKAFYHIAIGQRVRDTFYNSAIVDFKKALQLDPSNSEAYFYLGIVYEAQGQYDPAMSYYNQFQKSYSGYDEGYAGFAKSSTWKVDLTTGINQYTDSFREETEKVPHIQQKTKYTLPSVDSSATFVNSIGMKLIWIPEGDFPMGNKDGDYDEKPVHEVKISQGFWIGQTEVTQDQYRAIMKENPSYIKNDNNPVERISWYEAMEFCKRLSEKEGRLYTLPTEAQWEYACRAGTTTAYFFGDDAKELSNYAWCANNSNGTTHPVALRTPNPWGLYDMYGNVWEWCMDWYSMDFYSLNSYINPINNREWIDEPYRVIRGGCWYSPPTICRTAARNGGYHNYSYIDFGFRVICVPN